MFQLISGLQRSGLERQHRQLNAPLFGGIGNSGVLTRTDWTTRYNKTKH